MKLKKIASLMLAGIMAVSMLAACGEGKKEENSGTSDKPETSVVTGIADAANVERSEHVKALEISYKENSDVAAALATATAKLYKSGDVEAAPNDYDGVAKDTKKVADELRNLLPGKFVSDVGVNFGGGTADGVKEAFVYTVGGSFDSATAAALVSQTMNTEMNSWLKAAGTLKASYDADMAAVKLTSKDDSTQSTWVVAIVFTQNLSNANSGNVGQN